MPLITEGKHFTVQAIVGFIQKGQSKALAEIDKIQSNAVGQDPRKTVELLQDLYIAGFETLFRHTRDKFDASIVLSKHPEPGETERTQCFALQTIIYTLAYEICTAKHYHAKLIKLGRDDQRELVERLSKISNSFRDKIVHAETDDIEDKTKRNRAFLEMMKMFNATNNQLFTMKSLCEQAVSISGTIPIAISQRFVEAKNAEMQMCADVDTTNGALRAFMCWPKDKPFTFE